MLTDETFLKFFLALRHLPLYQLGIGNFKMPCRFWGVGCGVMVEVKNGKIVGVTGDKLPVNKGLLCIKGYSLPAILYGKDR